mgnify:CR=1 FL=1
MMVVQKANKEYVAEEKYFVVKQGIFYAARQRGPIRAVLGDSVKLKIETVFADLNKAV